MRNSKKTKKKKVIIITEPGVDDAACLAFMLFDNNIDTKLITTLRGNVPIEKATRNALHLLDLFGKDVPVAKGEPKALYRNSPTAEFIHQKEGLGGYNPPKSTSHKLIKDDAIEAMYKILKEGEGDIIPIVLGPHTNIAKLILLHPDIVSKIPCVYFEGGSPYGVPGFPDHISFNISSDPEAFKILLDSKIPLYMIPSDMGRRKAHLTEEFVYKIKDINEMGNFFYQMYSKYWEPGFEDKRIATNDTCVYLLLQHPELFDLRSCEIAVDCDMEPGKTFVNFTDKGHVKMAVAIKRKKFLKIMLKNMKKFNKFKLNNFKKV